MKTDIKYTSLKQVLRKRGRGYQIVAKDLEDFLSHDYKWHYRDLKALINSCGGDAWNWEVKDDTVYLTFQFASPKDKPIKVDLQVFRQVVKLLGDSRKL